MRNRHAFARNLSGRDAACARGTAKECRFPLHAPVYAMSPDVANRAGGHRESQAVRISFLFTNSSAARSPSSRPVPLRFTPPNGSSGESASTRLT